MSEVFVMLPEDVDRLREIVERVYKINHADHTFHLAFPADDNNYIDIRFEKKALNPPVA